MGYDEGIEKSVTLFVNLLAKKAKECQEFSGSANPKFTPGGIGDEEVTKKKKGRRSDAESNEVYSTRAD